MRAELASWTPVSLNLGHGPESVDWGDLRATSFTEPFFDQTIERWAGSAAARLVRTDLDALLDLEAAPSPEPSALIFHLSRCGSTLLSRLLGTLPGLRVISEPSPLNSLLTERAHEPDDAHSLRLLRALVAALGRGAEGAAPCYVLKLSSWNIRKLALYRAAFPRTKLIWLQRAPREVLASLLRQPAGWLQLRHDPLLARAIFGIDEEDALARDLAGFCGEAVASLLDAARDLPAAATLYLDYRDLPAAVASRVAPFLGLTLGDDDRARLAEEARFDAKEAGRRPFVPPPLRPLPPEVERFAVGVLAPLYDELDARRRAQLDAADC
jgi:hypothetical protein